MMIYRILSLLITAGLTILEAVTASRAAREGADPAMALVLLALFALIGAVQGIELFRSLRSARTRAAVKGILIAHTVLSGLVALEAVNGIRAHLGESGPWGSVAVLALLVLSAGVTVFLMIRSRGAARPFVIALVLIAVLAVREAVNLVSQLTVKAPASMTPHLLLPVLVCAAAALALASPVLFMERGEKGAKGA